MRLAQITVVAVALLMGGCQGDPASGVGTMASLPAGIDPKCVEAALKATPGVGEVSKPTVSNYADRTTYDWDYGGELNATLELTMSKQGVDYNNSNIRMGRNKAIGKAFEPLMRRVNEQVERRCGAPISKTASVNGF